MGSEPRVSPRPDLIDLPVLQKLKLYSTCSNFYLVGKDEKGNFRRVLKIDRTDPNKLILFEDPTNYTKEEVRQLKKRLDQGNGRFGGLEEVTTCYGIIGFVRFLEPYYMLVITKKKKVGEICGHTVYGIAESKMIAIPHPTIQTEVAGSLAERRYKNLLNIVDLSRNFYFSYTYHLMYCLQKNICNSERGNCHYNTMFVWNAFLTRGIRTDLQNSIWTVALIYGFFQQTKCSISGKEFVLTVIARRSRHYAGTRYLRRGVNKLGRVANDVETEQIVSKEVPEGQKIPIASVVQNRGSIPLFWAQETSIFNPQPEIKLNKKERNYEATQHHFENLRQRYGSQIIILNLLKTNEKKRGETILRSEFAKAILFINRGLMKEHRLKAIHFDLSKHHKSGATGAFKNLCIFANKAMELTGMFFCEAPSGVGAEGVVNESFFDNPLPSQVEEARSQEKEDFEPDIRTLQNGVLRSNCIDCLDRTNFAQYALGLVALELELHTLGIIASPTIELNSPLAENLMESYQKMGNTLAMQYGGSGAHSKMFSDLRGDWNVVTKQRDLITALCRHYSNTYQDTPKQDAINLFLGHFQPQLGKLELWELDSDHYHNIGRYNSNLDIQNIRPLIRRSFSDNVLLDGDLNLEEPILEHPQPSREGLYGGISGTNSDFSFYEAGQPASQSFLESLRFEDHLKETGSTQVFPGKCSYSDYRRHDDQPDSAKSFKTNFTPAEELFEQASTVSWSSDNIYTDMDESVTSLSRTNSSFEFPTLGVTSDGSESASGLVLVPGFSDDFSRWVFYGRTF